jgi:hypothetical protein
MEQLLIIPDTNITEHNPLRGLYFIKLGIIKVGKPGSTMRKFAGDIIGEESLLDASVDLLQVICPQIIIIFALILFLRCNR